MSVDFNLEFENAEGETMKIVPPECKRCHHTWWPTKFDWIKGEPKDATWCPCCISPKYQEPFVNDRGPDEEDGVLAYCPRCDIEFFSREKWLEKQAAIRNHEGNPYLPVPLAEKEKAKLTVKTLEAIAK